MIPFLFPRRRNPPPPRQSGHPLDHPSRLANSAMLRRRVADATGSCSTRGRVAARTERPDRIGVIRQTRSQFQYVPPAWCHPALGVAGEAHAPGDARSPVPAVGCARRSDRGASRKNRRFLLPSELAKPVYVDCRRVHQVNPFHVLADHPPGPAAVAIGEDGPRAGGVKGRRHDSARWWSLDAAEHGLHFRCDGRWATHRQRSALPTLAPSNLPAASGARRASS